MTTTSARAQQLDGHFLTVTPGVFGRAFVDCECGFTTRRASKHAGNLAALEHQRLVQSVAATPGSDPLADVEGGGPLG